MKSKNLIIMIMMVTCLIVANVKCYAQDTLNNQQWNKDQLFPSQGKSSLFLSTGIPYLGAAEYSYGFTNKFSVGAFYAKMYGKLSDGYGLRFRKVLYSSENNFRIYGELPIVYYPKTAHLENWFLVYPALMFEKKFSTGLRLSMGTGILGAACADFIFTGHDEFHPETPDTRNNVFKIDGGFMGGAWYTINSGISFPVAHKIMFTERFDVVANGIKAGEIQPKNWFYNPHIITWAGLTFDL